MKPPNVKEIIGPVEELLHAKRYEASGNRIAKLAGDPRHKTRRRRPGATLANEKRHQQKSWGADPAPEPD